MRTGVLAERTGVPISALRFYEAQGLLESERTPANYRVFPASAVDQVRRIQSFRALNVSLPEIKRIMDITHSPQENCVTVCDVIQRNLTKVRRQIKQFQHLEKELQRLAGLCSGPPNPTGCGILKDLDSQIA